MRRERVERQALQIMVRILLAVRCPFDPKEPLAGMKDGDLTDIQVLIGLHRVIPFRQRLAGVGVSNAVMACGILARFISHHNAAVVILGLIHHHADRLLHATEVVIGEL